jgi:hypothetical protein
MRCWILQGLKETIVAIFEHEIINYEKKFEIMKSWQDLSIEDKVKVIDDKLCDIYDKRQVILRDFSKRFSEEVF